MVASAVFITDLQGKAIISRNYRGDVPLTKAIEQFARYLTEVEDEAKKPVFHVDPNGDIVVGDEVGGSGVGGEHFIYVAVSRIHSGEPCSMFVLFPNHRANSFSITASKRVPLCRHYKELQCSIDIRLPLSTGSGFQRLLWIVGRRIDKG
jgi:hypothetical protein